MDLNKRLKELRGELRKNMDEIVSVQQQQQQLQQSMQYLAVEQAGLKRSIIEFEKLTGGKKENATAKSNGLRPRKTS